MEIQPISLWAFFVEVVASILLVGFVILLGRQLTKTRRWFVGTTSPRWTYVETGILNLAFLVPNLLLIIISIFYKLTNELMAIVNVSSTILFGMSFIALPLLAAIRLEPPGETNPKAYVARYVHTTVGLLLTVFLTSGFSYMLLPRLFFRVFAPWVEYIPLYDLFILTLVVVIEFVVVFLLLRGFMELARFVYVRNHKPKMITEFQPPSRTQYYSYSFLSIGIVFVLVLWVIAYVLYHNRDIHPDWIYIPPIYHGTTLVPSSPISPFDRSPISMLATAVPPVIILFIGLFISRRTLHIDEQVSLVFGILCLFYGLWGLDVFPRVGGPFFWALRLLAWLFITPVQLHFALVFPYEDESIAGKMRSSWLWVKDSLYAGFALISPLWLFFHFNTYQENSILMQERGYLIPLWALWGIVGSLSLISTWLFSAYILWHTWRGLGHVLGESQTDYEDGSGCRWLDIVEGWEQKNHRLEMENGRQQLKWVAFGTFVAAILFIVWLLMLFPVVAPNSDQWGIWSDVAIKSSFLFVFGAVFMAIRQYRLWDIDRILVDAFLWSILAAVLAAIYVYLESSMENSLQRTVGYVTFFVMAKFSLDRWLSPFVYGIFWKGHYGWQQKLISIGRQLRDSKSWSPTIKNARQLLSDACPERASAAWLIIPSSKAGDTRYQIHAVNHSHSSQDLCKEKFLDYLQLGNPPDQVRMAPDLIERLTYLVGTESERVKVLVVDRLFRERGVYKYIDKQLSSIGKLWLSRGRILRIPGVILVRVANGMASFGKWIRSVISSIGRQLFSIGKSWLDTRKQLLIPGVIIYSLGSSMIKLIHRQEVPNVSDGTIERLLKARIALIVPFGGGNLSGIFLIATDGRGDYYDEQDLGALAKFADQFSIWQR